jgi:folate-dependent phosphoribosylglycinamide formyltransferase PurN
LLCHEEDAIDMRGLSRWLAHSMRLAGLVVIQDDPRRKLLSARRERKRSGWLGLLDVFAFRAFYAVTLAAGDRRWTEATVAELERRYPASIDEVPRLFVTTPNSDETRQFLARLQPDLVIARCKMLLKPEIFAIPRHGTFVMHPGICPEYRNAHGCFWALVRRDLARVGMTLLRVDKGVDTGPVFFHGRCAFDEARDSHITIQYRVVTANLDAIARTLCAVTRGDAEPLPTTGRASAVWGQPRLSAYWRWKRAVRRERQDATRLTAVS